LATERSSSPRIVSRAGAAQVPANDVLATDEMLEARATIGMFSVELMAIAAEAGRSLDRDPARFRSFYDEVLTVVDDQESLPSLATRVRQDVPKTVPKPRPFEAQIAQQPRSALFKPIRAGSAAFVDG
jgi:hypothetical protein